jgi:hypothetical protein
MSENNDTQEHRQADQSAPTVLDELASALKRMEGDFAAIGDADTDEAQAARGRLYLEAAAYFGYLALVATPGAKNYVVCSIRFDGADDPAHAAMSFEARWRSGKTPDESLKELNEKIRRLENEWREMKAERDEALSKAVSR